MNFCFVYITNTDKAEAERIAKHLLDKKLIACANIYDGVFSIYPWENKLAQENECVLIGKTLERNYERVVTEVEKIHSYSVPCVIKIPMEVNKKYAEWLMSEIKDE